jgi:hypothetical protein
MYLRDIFYTHAMAIRVASRRARETGRRCRVVRGPDPERVSSRPMWLILSAEVAEPPC